MSIGERDPDDYPIGGPDEEEGFLFEGDGEDVAAELAVEVEVDRHDTMEPALPALYHHCVRLFNHMKGQARQHTEGLIWEGALLNTMTDELGLGNAHYTSITRKLKAMGCMKSLRRGGGPSPSVWLLIADPTPGRFRAAPDTVTTPRQNKVAATRQEVDQRLRDMNRRLQHLERIAISQGWPL